MLDASSLSKLTGWFPSHEYLAVVLFGRGMYICNADFQRWWFFGVSQVIRQGVLMTFDMVYK